jgi:hypothetical protein
MSAHGNPAEAPHIKASDSDSSAAALVTRHASSEHALKAALAQQQSAVELLSGDLGLKPHELAASAPCDHATVSDGSLHMLSADGTSGALVSAWQGPSLRWLSSSTIVSPGQGFSATRLLGLAGGGSDVPHLSLSSKIEGGKVMPPNCLIAAVQAVLPVSSPLCVLLAEFCQAGCCVCCAGPG